MKVFENKVSELLNCTGIYEKFKLESPFSFELGGTIPYLEIAYETWGKLNSQKDNAILLETGLSASPHAKSSSTCCQPGWWEDFIGPGKPLDTDRYFIICSNPVGGCFGSTGPGSINPITGRHYGTDFPKVTIGDIVNAQKELIDYLGINKLHLVIGASMGGMLAFQWGAYYPNQVRNLISMSAPGRAYPQSIAFRYVQRLAVMNDPDWHNGFYYEQKKFPSKGLSLARQIGTITYRSLEELNARFGRSRAGNDCPFTKNFQVENYLEHHGEKFNKFYDPNSYLYLSKAMDLFDLGLGIDSYEHGIQRMSMRTLIIGVTTDMLFPIHEQREVYQILQKTNPHVDFVEIYSIYGHDAFLKEVQVFSKEIRRFLIETAVLS